MAEAPSRQILHVDMDAFYASVEEREDPSLKGKPVVVSGAPDGRGVVSAANYVARRYGVGSAMPAARAKRLCPHAIFIPPRHSLYAEVSRQINAVFKRYTPLVEPLALDEAFLDVTASGKLFGLGLDIARRIKAEIADETSLIASVGVAPNKFLAKLASDLDKPDGLVWVRSGEEQRFLDPLPVKRIWGVGRHSAETLERMGIATIGDLRRVSPEHLAQVFGKHGEHISRLARGLDERPVVPEHAARSISHETTFAEDVKDADEMRAWLVELAEQVASRARRHELQGRTVQIKVRFHDFRTVTRAITLEHATHSSRELRKAVDILFRERLGLTPEPVRLLGVGLSGFNDDGAQQADLFADEEQVRDTTLDDVLDRARTRFGRTALRRGLSPKR